MRLRRIRMTARVLLTPPLLLAVAWGAAAIWFDVPFARLYAWWLAAAFAIGSALGGLAGALAAPLVQFIDPPAFGLVHSLRLLLMVVVGGSGFFFGPILGAGLVIVLPEFLRFTEEYYLMIYATLVLVLMIFCPTGIIGLIQRAAQKWRGQRVRGDLEQGAQL